ncbi:MAG: hypothetical protein K8I65_13160 [Thermoanaerobaculia bacterium]|nr:hypothetical protein [Thermoanaerobaculia bacterium]
MKVWIQDGQWVCAESRPPTPEDAAVAAGQWRWLWAFLDRLSLVRQMRRFRKRIGGRHGGRVSRRSRRREFPEVWRLVEAAARGCQTRRPGSPLTVHRVLVEVSDADGAAADQFHRMGARRQRRFVEEVLRQMTGADR